ncbi:MAG: AMP-binding protein [Kiritimatiellae bacterium]|nr:AMP-binding protein [Kiritimatiellia bacterium]
MRDENNLLEWLEPDAARTRQDELLRGHLRHAFAHSPYYREMLAPFAERLSTVTCDTLVELPTTDKRTFAERTQDFLAAPQREISDIVFSSGTTGIPTPVAYSRADMDRLAFNERISLRACGIAPDDTALMTCTLDRCFVAGYAYYLGLTTLGAAAIRNGINTVESHAAVMRRLHPTVLVGVPGFLLRLGRHLRESGQDDLTESVHTLVCAGDPLRDRAMRQLPVTAALESVWNAKAYSTYASSEIVTSFCECTAQQGGHLHPELAVVEILDETGKRLPPGEVGEVVVTPLQVEAVPLVRFRTGDMSFLIDTPCPCGRKSVRLGPILGRRNQMMKVRGTTVYPAAFLNALDAIHGVAASFVTVRGGEDLSDRVTVTAAVKDSSLTSERLSDLLFATLRLHPAVELLPEAEVLRRIFNPASHKPRRFFDERESLR